MTVVLPFLPLEPVRISDAHVHFYGDAEADALLEAAERYGVQRIFASCLGRPPMSYDPSMEDTRQFNRLVARAMARHPGTVFGYSYVSPVYEGEALAEFRTCVEDLGLRGLKLWMACYCDDPRAYPIVEQAIAYSAPILIHTYSIVGGSKPNESEADHVARLARRYPEARIIMAHMSGNWPVTLRTVRPYPNVHVDSSGIDPEDGQIETAVALLGARRVLFGSDIPIRDLGSQIAKVLGADVDAEARALILGGNFERLVSQTGGEAR